MSEMKPDPVPGPAAARRTAALRAVESAAPAASAAPAVPPAALPAPPQAAASAAAPPASPPPAAAPGREPPAAEAGPEPAAEAAPRPGSDASTRAAARAARAARAAARTRAVPPADEAGAARPAPAHGPAESPAPQPQPRRKARPQPGRARPAGTPHAPGAPVAIPAAEVTLPGPAPEPARMRLRHRVMILSFLAMVALPFLAAAAYLYGRAADQYHSEVAFSIRSEEGSSAAAGLLGAITNLGTGSASDIDILAEYIRSQGIVETIDREIDLRAIFNRATGDPIFTLGPDASIEELAARWRRMVQISFESAAGILHVEARAFAPEDARAISQAILRHSSALVNHLSEQARSDAVRFATEELTEAEAALYAMRAKLAAFRREHRIVDPSGDVEGQAGLLNALQTELAQALVERDMLRTYADERDQRVLQANRRIDAINARIEAERASLGGPGAGAALPEVVGRYEELLVDLEFANTAYTQGLANLAAARAEARRQSRYLAPHVQPTLAEKALYPRRALLAGLTLLFLTLGWSMAMLIYYNIRDNR